MVLLSLAITLVALYAILSPLDMNIFAVWRLDALLLVTILPFE